MRIAVLLCLLIVVVLAFSADARRSGRGRVLSDLKLMAPKTYAQCVQNSIISCKWPSGKCDTDVEVFHKRCRSQFPEVDGALSDLRFAPATNFEQCVNNAELSCKWANMSSGSNRSCNRKRFVAQCRESFPE